MESTVFIITAFVSYILGKIAKKNNYIKEELIPLSNLFVGIIMAIIYYFATKNISVAIAVSGIFAGGTYDIMHNIIKLFNNNKLNSK